VNHLVAQLMDRFDGNRTHAARAADLSVRHVQRWFGGQSTPNGQSERKILMFLEGDEVRTRELRLQRYEERAAAGLPLFD